MIEWIKEKKEVFFFLILDSIEDLYNFGLILWIVDVSGVDGVIILKYWVVGIMFIVIKIFIGVVEYVFVVCVMNLV